MTLVCEYKPLCESKKGTDLFLSSAAHHVSSAVLTLLKTTHAWDYDTIFSKAPATIPKSGTSLTYIALWSQFITQILIVPCSTQDIAIRSTLQIFTRDLLFSGPL